MTRKISQIHVHHSGNPDSTAESIHRYHTIYLHWSDAGYHVVIERAGKPVPARPLDVIPASIAGHNPGARAVCVCGDLDRAPMAPPQRKALVRLLADWCERYGLDYRRDIYGHRELAPLRLCPATREQVPQTCPGLTLDMDALRIDVGRALLETA